MSAFPPEPPSRWPRPAPAWRSRRERWWLHLLLFVLTLGTTTYLGAFYAVNYRPSLAAAYLVPGVGASQLLAGALTYSLPLVGILLAHELGHYLACRWYRIDASPPYFIPLPFLTISGTLGAFIRIREPFGDRRQLFDVGVAGPIAGFLVSLPVAAWGILHTRVNLEPVEPGTILFHYPLAITLLQKALIGHTFTSAEVVEHPALIAGWWGFFLTAFNLVPAGQLDGGHAVYALVGPRARRLAVPSLVLLAGAALVLRAWWLLVLLALVLFVGLRHPPVLFESRPLGPGRKATAALVAAILALCFLPVPIEEIEASAPRRAPVEGDGPVVDQLHLHRRAEDARRHLEPGSAKPRDVAVEEGAGQLGAGRPLEPGPPPA